VPRRSLTSIVLLLIVLVSPAQAQFDLASRNDSASSASRTAEYQALARDVAALETELGIYKRVARLVTPSVVHIEAAPVDSDRRRREVHEAGSGVIIELEGSTFVLTNRHVVKNSEPAYVRIHLGDGTVFKPRQILSDRDTDIAILKVDAEGLIPARLGNSQQLDIGDQVLAIGSPFGLSQSVTRGIISAKGRYNLDLGNGDVRFQNFLQTDAAINPGNSGGPLVNLRGEVVGLNTAIASSSGGNEGIGFSIPINIAVRIARDLATRGEVTRGFLGVKLDSLFDERRARQLGMPRLTGTRVSSVDEQSPAHSANLMVEDVILVYDGIRVEDDDHLISLVNLTEVGREVQLIVFRQRRTESIKVRIGDRRQFQPVE
jgi:serine protease Do